MHKILQTHLLRTFVANLKIDAIYALYPESFCSKDLAIRKVFAFSDSGWLPHLFRRGDFLMGFPFVDFQTILCFEIKITLVTLKAFALLL